MPDLDLVACHSQVAFQFLTAPLEDSFTLRCIVCYVRIARAWRACSPTPRECTSRQALQNWNTRHRQKRRHTGHRHRPLKKPPRRLLPGRPQDVRSPLSYSSLAHACMQTACPNLPPRVPGGVGATTTAAAPTLTARTSGVLACSGQLLSCPPAYLSVLLHPACAAHAAPSPALRRHPGTNPCVPLTPESVVIIFP